MQIQKKPANYEPSMTGKRYELGVLNLCYRGNRYKLKDGILIINVDSRVSAASAASYKFQARIMDDR